MTDLKPHIMLSLDSFTYSGKIVATHGIKGELTCNIIDEAIEGITETDVVFVMINGGLVPYFIEDDGLRSKGSSSVLIKFDDIDTKEIADNLVSKELYLPNELVYESDENTVVGYTAIDSNKMQQIGEVKDVLEFSGNVLLQVEYNGGEVLIPYNEDTIVETDEDKETIVIEVPDGLLEL